MQTLKNDELMLIINEIDQAINYHSKWYKKILRNLITKSKPEALDLKENSHEFCDFGEWYKNFDKKVFIKEGSTFLSIAKTHYQVHFLASQLLQNLVDEHPITVEKWDQFDLAIDEMQHKFKLLRNEVLEQVNDRDPLTKARNRTTMLHNFRKYYDLYQKDRLNSALVMFDLDHFTKINNTYGHAVGDEVLIAVVKCAMESLRPYDFIYRYGGEEFLLLMPSTTLKQAEEVAERLRVNIENQHVFSEKHLAKIKVTASFGVTVFTDDRTVEESIDFADTIMYEAKATGRNFVITAI